MVFTLRIAGKKINNRIIQTKKSEDYTPGYDTRVLFAD